MARFDGRVAMVTGAARGQGRAHAVALAREGADVVICDIGADLATVPYPLGTGDELEATAEAVRAEGRRCLSRVLDVRSTEQLADLVADAHAELDRIDVLVANAGICSFGQFWDITDEQWDEMVSTNLTGAFKTLRAVVPGMRERRYGRIVATSSMGGRMGNRNLAHYVATKWGVIGLVKTLAQEVAREGITVNAVCPATVDTPMVHNDAMYSLFCPEMEAPTRQDVEPRYRAMNQMREPWLPPEAVTDAVLHLASDAARYTSGTTLDVCFGNSAGMP